MATNSRISQVGQVLAPAFSDYLRYTGNLAFENQNRESRFCKVCCRVAFIGKRVRLIVQQVKVGASTYPTSLVHIGGG